MARSAQVHEDRGHLLRVVQDEGVPEGRYGPGQGPSAAGKDRLREGKEGREGQWGIAGW